MDDLYLKDELPLQQNAEYRRVTFFLIGNFRVNNKVSQVTLQIFMKRTQRTPQPGVRFEFEPTTLSIVENCFNHYSNDAMDIVKKNRTKSYYKSILIILRCL